MAATGAGGASNENPKEERDEASSLQTSCKEDSELRALWVGVPLWLHPIFRPSFLRGLRHMVQLLTPLSPSSSSLHPNQQQAAHVGKKAGKL